MANITRREHRDVSAPSPGRYWDPFSLMESLLRWDPYRSEGFMGGGAVYSPQFDLKENKDAYILKADLPGVKDSDVEINLTGNTLQISGTRQDERVDEGERYYRAERSYGQFSRTLTLPEGADFEHVNADMKDGVLTVTIPKRPEVQPRRITVGSGGNTGKPRA
ncbi:MAG TPA: HSP20 family small heat-shock protein [Polyangia bacterium]